MGKIWLVKVAEKYNYADAQYMLGMMLYPSNNMEENKTQGVEWLEKASDGGSQLAHDALRKISGKKVKKQKINTEKIDDSASADQQ